MHPWAIFCRKEQISQTRTPDKPFLETNLWRPPQTTDSSASASTTDRSSRRSKIKVEPRRRRSLPPAPMAIQTAKPSSGSSSGGYPRWVLLQQPCKTKVEGSSSSCPTADARTLAASRTTSGHLIQVGLHLAESPAASCVCLQLPDGVDAYYSTSTVGAAHGDSVLIQICIVKEEHQR